MNSEPPRTRPDPGKSRATSLILVNTGDGKGKSTAAFGTMLRAVARGWKVAVVQFVKSGRWNAGEEEMGRRLGVDWWAAGDGFTWDSDDLEGSRRVARRAWELADGLIGAGGHDLVVLDEITYPVNWGWIPLSDVLDALESRPSRVNLILTGRDAPPELVRIADIVTDMRKIKHAYDRGIRARRGIDY